MIYLDNAATTYPKPEILYEKLDYAYRSLSFNAGRGHYQKAQDAYEAIEKTRKFLIQKANGKSLVFTPSATYALNQIIQGINFEENDIVYCSPYEHNSVARTLNAVRKSKHIELKLIPLNKDLSIDLSSFRFECITNKPKVIFCSHVSNVTGYILPIHEIGQIAKENGSIFVVDGAQAFGVVPVNMEEDNIDYYVFAGHKTLYGPLGIGGYLFCTNELNLSVFGGTGTDSLNLDMPKEGNVRFEPSSPNAVAAYGLYHSSKWVFENDVLSHERFLADYLVHKLKNIPEIILYSNLMGNRTGIISFNIKGMKSDDVASILDEDFKIEVRAGYHCAPFIHDYIKSKPYLGTVRISFSYFTTIEDVNTLVNALEEIVLEV
ncbi:aminotransferase class V-fold PLP-dependent enzyme [Allocoprobacillus halotolerans]|uniref:Aminotransferase class V-fold PLP-dependent enzyme n=1 Tax=Allocoprobacillus halotolerans TaxID=2944914 RepID=A0ABY5I5P4_9FIRM|nr:aminotransferase class V-fold PLP-dependent enzyme [Allocoprobacillus halotolerans]UTY39272.1 aminotransferase class V-fold PLP-dependent enzyme [Allocoprobacillus halotolerans]